MAGPTDSNEQLLCSFCGKSQRQVKKLIAGPGVYICDECIDLCNEIIDEESVSAAAPAGLDLDRLPRPQEINAVLDEYVHVLQDHLGLMDHELEDRVHKTTDELGEALGLRPSQVRIQDIRLSESGRTVRRESRNLVTQFAARFADQKTDEGADTRADQVRKAFNSPFWPFVLATTSVGQEGLDFHPYCHAVVHWNLPSNPVDLEQREGRVHRYKGHAVRRNVAHTHGWGALTDEERDVWLAIFQRARAEAEGRGQSEIVPFWVYPVDGGAKIERHVLALPLSREHAQGARLKNTLTVYRMVFGQPRQDDLVRYLLERVPKEQLDGLLATARIDLSPRTAGHRA